MASLQAGVGRGTDRDPAVAGQRAAERASEGVGGSEQLAFAFASSVYDQGTIIRAIDEVLNCPVSGCSTSGEITGSGSFTESVVVLVLAGEGLRAGCGLGTGFGADPRAAGREATASALTSVGADSIPTDVLTRGNTGWRSASTFVSNIYGDAIDSDKLEGLRGARESLGPSQTAGGWAADDWNFERTWVYHGGNAHTDAITVTALDLDVAAGVGVANGLQPTDRSYTVTAADNGWVYELDGRPAGEVYRDLFGDRVRNTHFLLTCPMGVSLGEGEHRIFVAHEYDEDRGALAVDKPLEEGWRVTIMDTSPETVLAGAEQAIDRALTKAGHPNDIAAVLIYDCNCRWYFLSNQRRRDAEIDAITDRVGPDVPIAGFYSYGEIGPPGPLAGWRNQSIVVEVISNEPV